MIGDALLNREPQYPWTTFSAQEETSREKIAFGYFSYGLYPEGYRYLLENHESVSDLLLMDAAQMLGDAGFYTWGIRIWNRLKENKFTLSSPKLKAAYPAAFEKDMSAAINKYSLPEEIFFALIREESYFDSEAVSWAGAVGLAQIMPSTAEDISGRLNIEIDDLTDPGTNLLLGGWYLGWLLDMFDLPLYALAAYNGGQSRVKKWIKENGDLPTALFAETIPLWETRGYIKKVLVSSVIYGYLYDHLSVRATVLKFFPDLPEISGGIQE
jgi:soluble lytic murein transglycosylase